MPIESFVVDAALLQELGERLIGRPAIALGELVKNAFDADATVCRIEFGSERIVVSDNGHGMNADEFVKHWMRIATTHKVDQRTSRSFERALTGSKGIGRLSAQFLADELTLDSTPRDTSKAGVHAYVDWRSAVPGTEIKEVTVGWHPESEVESYAASSESGTRIELAGLKTVWDAKTLQELGNDVWMLRSPFKGSAKGSASTKRDEFTIEIEAPEVANAREAFDRTLATVFANWKARITGRLEHGRSGGKAVVSVEFRKGYPTSSDKGRRFQTTTRFPVSDEHAMEPLIDSTSFEILIFKPAGKQPGGVAVGDLREYLSRFGNVSVYDAGFRLPYYGSKKDEIGEDWLSIAADQGRRLGQSDLLPEHLQTQNKYMEDLPAPGRIFGAVDIDTNHERRTARLFGADDPVFLQIQSGRDRLHDNDAFYQLRDLVRYSVDYYANRYRARKLEARERERPLEAPSVKLDRAVVVLEENRTGISPAVYRALKQELSEAAKARKAEEGVAEQRAALLAPLASAGMTALALNHEISRESTFLGRIGRRLRQLATKHSLPELSELATEFDEGKRRLDSVRGLFAPLLTDEDRSATDRLRVQVVVRQVVKGMSVLMPGVKIDFHQIPSDLRFPLGSLAEWSAVLQNVLSNAWNAMLDSTRREVFLTGGRDGSSEWLLVSDTGQGLGLSPSESSQLFEPFERRIEVSRDKRSIAIGGQGLGLAIVRMLARRRKANVAFRDPLNGFSTTFELSWRRPKS
jgi:signal transduction histidine kinase